MPFSPFPTKTTYRPRLTARNIEASNEVAAQGPVWTSNLLETDFRTYCRRSNAAATNSTGRRVQRLGRVPTTDSIDKLYAFCWTGNYSPQSRGNRLLGMLPLLNWV